jgi:hypothetical protein
MRHINLIWWSKYRLRRPRAIDIAISLQDINRSILWTMSFVDTEIPKVHFHSRKDGSTPSPTSPDRLSSLNEDRSHISFSGLTGSAER